MTSVTSQDMEGRVECNWFPTEESKEKSTECQKSCIIDPTQTFCTVCKRTMKEIRERGKTSNAYG
jgi:hypothetical protein